MTFDPDFASAAEWARLYRTRHIQVVPAWLPSENKSWKRPLLPSWAEYQHALVPDSVFEPWYGPAGQYVARPNMGAICGIASDNLMIIDLDDHKTIAAAQWWHALLELHNNGMELETVEQRTGGGGRQKLFHCPSNWTPPTNKTPIGVDIRGQGGFAMLAPSIHESGKSYEWLEGRSPDDIDIMMAPDWLMKAVDELVEKYGHLTTSPKTTPSAASDGYNVVPFDGFGRQTDLREDKMTRLIWGAVVDWYRECPIPPPQRDSDVYCAEKYLIYEGLVAPRVYEPTLTKTQMLDREGRGPVAFHVKWQHAMAQWETNVRDAANEVPLKRHEQENKSGSTFQNENVESEEQTKPGPAIQPISGPLLLTAEQFVAGFTPPAYLIDNILQRGYLYSLTARTGHGKTAVAMYIAQCIARGEAMHGCPVKQGTVLLLAGENPDDIRARFLVLAEAYGFRPESLKMRFVAGVVNLAANMPQIRAEAAAIEDLVLVIVDTAAAYFPGDETNSNSQQGSYARSLRELTFLPGLPAVLVNCHPIKNASRDNLIPMGGSAFLNEVDGNLTLWANAEKQMSLHWLGKFRGPEFNPLSFEITVETSDRVKDAEGRLMPNAVAKPISDAVLERAEELQTSDEDRLLRLIWNRKRASFADYALELGLKKIQVQRIADRLKGDKLAEIFRGRLRLTAKGEKELGVGKRKNDDDWG